MLSNLLSVLRFDRSETVDTGTFADGTFQLAEHELKRLPKVGRGQISYSRDYGRDRSVQPGAIGRV
ncbi:hypothetical protein [Mycoplana rhizolycopersici]|uniref:Uncharacterized protein n=1 Tax=Mycoplana rhizolycopersici TaxID=2746702 RepID=A0ABX2QA34_9HYPH|nr:hypothetical protein [Rhizobium rhizolycopersici]NVP54028.1 hypothetical protein [Rhizobium rhizolycopersici]